MPKPVDYLPKLNQDAKLLVYRLFEAQIPTGEILARLKIDWPELVTSEEVIDKARIRWRESYDEIQASRNRAIIATLGKGNKAYDQLLIGAACEQQAGLLIDLGVLLGKRMEAAIKEYGEDGLDWRELGNLIGAAGALSTATANIARTQGLLAKFAIELPYRASQTSGEQPETRNKITPEFVKEIEGMLGVLPYEQEAEAEPTDAVT
jgi:hypothetical protein